MRKPSMIQIQRRYIDAVNGAQPRFRALVRGGAERRALADLKAWGFSREQADEVIDEARAIEVLERLAAEAEASA